MSEMQSKRKANIYFVKRCQVYALSLVAR